jgi:hypothetical protein
MTEQERKMVKTLCARITEEKDRKVFTELLIELDGLLQRMSAHPPPTHRPS